MSEYYNLKTLFIIVGTIGVLSILNKLSNRTNKGYSNAQIKHVEHYIRSSQHYFALSKQDKNMLTSLNHSIYALSFAKVAKSLTSNPEKDIARICKVNIDQYLKQLQTHVDLKQKKIVEICPKFNGYVPCSISLL